MNTRRGLIGAALLAVGLGFTQPAKADNPWTMVLYDAGGGRFWGTSRRKIRVKTEQKPELLSCMISGRQREKKLPMQTL